MKRYLPLLLSLNLISCTYDNEEDLLGALNCDENPSSFSLNVQPLVEQNCAVSGCHVPGGQLPDLTNFSSIQQNSFLIKNRIENRTMPPPQSGKQLSEQEIHTISCWVDNGAANN